MVLPLLVSEGTLGALIVKTRKTDTCLNTVVPAMHWSPREQERKTDAILELCRNRLDQGCAEKYYLQKPKILKRRLQQCVFPGGVCQNGSSVFEITHFDITLKEFGLTWKPKATLNHHLTCSPINLDPFLLATTNPNHRADISAFDIIGYPNVEEEIQRLYKMSLNTMSGPSWLSSQNSGRIVAQRGGPYSLNILPSIHRETRGIDNATMKDKNTDFIHPALRREDGASFLVVYRAGASVYPMEYDEPIFGAHTQCFEFASPKFYCADTEATGLGCFEQFQYCLPKSGFCTPWGFNDEPLQTVRAHVEPENSIAMMAVIWGLELARNFLTTHNYLFLRSEIRRAC